MRLSFFLGILLLYLGSEALIKGSSSFAQRLKIKPLVIGLTVIAFSTSSPELVVSIKAVLAKHGDISAGDIIGSNIFNVAGILSFCALFKSIPLKRQILKFDLPVMFLAYCLFSIFLLTGKITRLAGIIFVLLVIIYTLALYFIPQERLVKEKEIEEELEKPLKNVYIELVFILGGLSFLIYGAHLLITGVIFLAKWVGISEAKIALSALAFGTSLPEISFCLIALWRKKYDLLVGNIIGSNIFNILAVIGTASLVAPIEIVNIRVLDLGMMFLTGILLFPFFQKNLFLHRSKAIVLLSLYFIYIFALYIN